MILKVLLVIAVIATVYFLFIKKKPLKNSSSNSTSEKKTPEQANDMIECAACGTYAELDDCILSNNKYYCSKVCVDRA